MLDFLKGHIRISQPNPNEIAEKTEKVEKAAEMQLSKLMQDFLREKEASNITTSTVLFHQVCCEDFVECVGDMPATEVNKAVVRKYLEMQKQLPAQRKKNPRYAKKTIEQILKMEGRLPETRYFFQKSAPEQNIKSIEYHKSELKEEIQRSDIQLWWSRARKLRKTEETNERLDLVLEILLSEQMERRLVYWLI